MPHNKFFAKRVTQIGSVFTLALSLSRHILHLSDVDYFLHLHFHLQYAVGALLMESNIPGTNAAVCARTSQPRVTLPQQGVHPTRGGVLDRNVAHRFLHAPDVHAAVERAGRAVLAVCRPRQRQDASAVEGPPRGDQLGSRLRWGCIQTR